MILNKLKFKKEIKDLYEAVKHLKCADIINSPDTLMAHDENGRDIELSMDDRKIVADGIKSMQVDTGIAYHEDDTLEAYVSRAAIGELLHEHTELEDLRKKAEELGI